MFADIVFCNGSVLTLDPRNTVHEAAVVKKNRIVYVGSNQEATAFIGRRTRIVNLHDKSLIPGFIDSHIHSAVIGANSLAIDCRPSSVSSIADICEAIYERTKTTPKGMWIRGWGYNDQHLKEGRHPDKWDLDKASPDHPVALTHVCNHISCYNTAAISKANISEGTAYDESVFVRRDGEFSGVMLEKAHFYMSKVAMLTDNEIEDAILAANDILIKHGITSIHDSGGYGPGQFFAFQETVKKGEFKPRIYMMIFSFSDNLELNYNFLSSGIHTGFGNEHIKIGPAKLMIDGSGSGPTAATFDEYKSRPGYYGILAYSQELLDDYVMRGHEGRWQVTSHAVGDKSVTMIVEAIRKAMDKYPIEDPRHRVEHCGMINNRLLEIINEYGIVPISNPVLLYDFGDDYINNYGRETACRMFTCKSFLNNGIISAGASNSPIACIDPLFGIHVAVNRKTKNDQIINPDERITPMEALRMYTYNGAYASFEEDIKGSIEVGKLADLVVLSGNFLRTPYDKLKDLKVEMTVIDGIIEYDEVCAR